MQGKAEGSIANSRVRGDGSGGGAGAGRDRVEISGVRLDFFIGPAERVPRAGGRNRQKPARRG